MHTLPPRIHVIAFQNVSGQWLEEHGVTDSFKGILLGMFTEAHIVSTDQCRCQYCRAERARYQVEPASEDVDCCACCTRPAPGLAPGAICAACAAFPLD